MHPFNYYAPETINEATEILKKYGDRARCLAGGTDVLVQARGEKFELDAIVDVKKIPQLTKLEWTDSHLIIGAATPCHVLYEDSKVCDLFPGIVDSAFLIGGIQIQSRASLGGNLCNASPSADAICSLIVHETTCEIAGPNGTREIPVEDMCTGPGKNALENGEFLVSLKIPLKKGEFSASYERFIPRNEMDIAVAAVASSLELSNGKVSSCRVALAAVGPTPIFAKEASELLVGKEPTDENIKKVSEKAKDIASPIADMRGTVEHRKDLIEVLTRRTISKALERAGG
ncbi:MAG: xanthine dehydrogenase family protein subunit M [Chloroflexota bacterium]|nr:xanthine dehydrogenase family protein subunit M [Chloroflexota bacterium]MQG04601.1 xanthine dehydrogenase family protein subunit M [SAR202 cluster bacterium]|tara:strand:- start:4985 stop:5848 length:864 start_codon:yes stop_codon:yes gene_type:complete